MGRNGYVNVHLYFYPRPWQALWMAFAYLSPMLEQKFCRQSYVVENFEGPWWVFSKFSSMDRQLGI